MKKCIWLSMLMGFLFTQCVSAQSISLVNSDFTADAWAEEQFIQNTGIGNGITGWQTEGLVRGYNLDEDGDGDPTVNTTGPRVWAGWQAGDGLRQVGFQSFQDATNALSQDAGTFTEGLLYTFSIQTGSGFENGNQDAFLEIRRASDDTLLSANNFNLDQNGTDPSDVASVSYTATAADAGSAIRIRFGTLLANGSGTVVFGPASLVAVPEPSSALCLIGLAGVAVLRRQTRQF